MGKQETIYICPRCRQANLVYYPIKTDLNRSAFKVDRDTPPLCYVSTDMTMFVGIRKCKSCNGHSVVVFYGWYFQPGAFAYLPFEMENQGLIGLGVAQWVIGKMEDLGLKIPKDLT